MSVGSSRRCSESGLLASLQAYQAETLRQPIRNADSAATGDTENKKAEGINRPRPGETVGGAINIAA